MSGDDVLEALRAHRFTLDVEDTWKADALPSIVAARQAGYSWYTIANELSVLLLADGWGLTKSETAHELALRAHEELTGERELTWPCLTCGHPITDRGDGPVETDELGHAPDCGGLALD